MPSVTELAHEYLDIIGDLAAAKKKKTELEADKEHKMQELLDAMVEAECPKIQVRDRLLFPIRSDRPTILKDMRPNVHEKLRELGFGALITESVHAGTFKSFWTKDLEENEDAREALLEAGVKVNEHITIGARKA